MPTSNRLASMTLLALAAVALTGTLACTSGTEDEAGDGGETAGDEATDASTDTTGDSTDTAGDSTDTTGDTETMGDTTDAGPTDTDASTDDTTETGEPDCEGPLDAVPPVDLPQPSDPQRLVQLVGPARAKLMLMGGDRWNAAQALAFGLVDQIVPAEELSAAVAARAADCAGADRGRGCDRHRSRHR